jgi:phenylacetate-CoA ligase
MPVIDEIATKEEDMIIRPDGTPISPSVLTHPFKPLKGVEKSQIVQERADLIVIKIVRKAGFSEMERQALLAEFQKRVGDTIRIETQYVDDIPRPASGKYRWVISKLAK